MSGIWNKIVDWARPRSSEEKNESPRSVMPRLFDPTSVHVAVDTFRESAVDLVVASARCGLHADKHLEHPYAFKKGSESEGGFIACLCDGSGDWGEGVAASRVAALEAVKICAQNIANVPDALCLALVSAHEKVSTYPADEEFGAACSAALVVIRDSALYAGWVGALEVLVVRGGKFVHRTTPHLLWRELVASGQLAPEQVTDFPLKEIITRSLGVTVTGKEPTDAVEIAGPWRIESGDLILLSSKRTHRMLSESEVLALANGDDLEGTVRGLLAATLTKEDYFELCAIAIRVDVRDAA